MFALHDMQPQSNRYSSYLRFAISLTHTKKQTTKRHHHRYRPMIPGNFHLGGPCKDDWQVRYWIDVLTLPIVLHSLPGLKNLSYQRFAKCERTYWPKSIGKWSKFFELLAPTSYSPTLLTYFSIFCARGIHGDEGWNEYPTRICQVIGVKNWPKIPDPFQC